MCSYAHVLIFITEVLHLVILQQVFMTCCITKVAIHFLVMSAWWCYCIFIAMLQMLDWCSLWVLDGNTSLCLPRGFCHLPSYPPCQLAVPWVFLLSYCALGFCHLPPHQLTVLTGGFYHFPPHPPHSTHPSTPSVSSQKMAKRPTAIGDLKGYLRI